MARTTEALVKGILLNDYDTVENPSLTPFIDTASALVDDAVACAAARNKPISSARAELIERWVAAHCYKCSDKATASENTKDASATFQGQTEQQLSSTYYGQTAMSLDPSNCIGSLGGKGQSARGVWLGKRPSAQIPYNQRS